MMPHKVIFVFYALATLGPAPLARNILLYYKKLLNLKVINSKMTCAVNQACFIQ